MKYAITFDLDTGTLREQCEAAGEADPFYKINEFFEEVGFHKESGNLYVGDKRVNSVTCVVAVQKLSDKFPWFYPSAKNIRLLRIEADYKMGPDVFG